MVDIKTVLTLTALNLFSIAVAMTIVMGRQLSTAARFAQRSLIAQALGWSCIVLAEFMLDMPLSILSMVFAAVANHLMLRALEGWTGRRSPRWRMTFMGIGVLMPIGYALSYGAYPVRVGWANLCLATQFAMLAYACTGLDGRTRSGRWQYLLGTCYASMAVLTLGRGILGAFLTELYPSFTTPHPWNIVSQVAANVSLVLSMMSVLVAWRREIEITLENQAHTDPLTGLLNRRGWQANAKRTIAHARQREKPVGVVLLDVDHFKHVNDIYGHAVGDHALSLLGRSIRSCLRDNDLAGRFGGEEFVLLLPGVDQDTAEMLDNRLREHYGRITQERLGFALNFSSGLAFCDWQQEDPLKRALTQADASMYMAKSHGRGQLYANADINITIPDQLI